MQCSNPPISQTPIPGTIYSATSWHADTSDPSGNKFPLVDASSSVTLLSASIDDAGSTYVFSRPLAPGAGRVPITKGNLTYVIWAKCKAAGGDKFAFHASSHSEQVLAVDFFGGGSHTPVATQSAAVLVGLALVAGLAAVVAQAARAHQGGGGGGASWFRSGDYATHGAMAALFLVLTAACWLAASALPGAAASLVNPTVGGFPTTVFYAFIALLSLLLLAAQAHPDSRLFALKRRVAMLGVSAGELLLAALYVGLNAWWYVHYQNAADLTGAGLVRTAKVVGHLNELNVALVLLPVARNSVWCWLFGLPFEKLVRYHRVLGRVVFLWVTLHMALWWRVWALNGDWTAKALRFDAGDATSDRIILTGELAWLCLLVVGLTALEPVRRRFFEVFYYTHHLYIASITLGLVHSVAVKGHLLEYMLLALVLLAVDRVFRAYRSRCQSYVTVRAASEGGAAASEPRATRLEVSRPALEQAEATGRTALLQSTRQFHTAGQYCFLCIPSLSPLQWHPFTIASKPSSPTLTFLIKDMGDDQWTGRLNQLVRGGGAPDVLVDGPYGASGMATHDYQRVLFVAGGVGITPVLAMLGDLVDRSQSSHRASLPLSVTLWWVVKSASSLQWAAPLLEELRMHPGLFEVKLFVTDSYERKDKPPSPPPANVTVNAVQNVPLDSVWPQPKLHPRADFDYAHGRPRLVSMLSEFADDTRAHGTDRCGVFVCGVPGMVSEIRAVCESIENGVRFDVHTEEFYL
jgi:predicted ferric reductase